MKTTFYIAVAVVLALVPLIGNAYLTYLGFTFLIYYTLSSAWNVTAGYGGLLSIGNQLFIGIAGYVIAILTYYLGWNSLIAWPAAALVAALFALLVGWTSTRRNRFWSQVVFVAILAFWAGYEIWARIYPEHDVFQNPFVRTLFFALIAFLWHLPMLRLEGAYFVIATWLIAACFEILAGQWSVIGAGSGMRIPVEIDIVWLYYLALGLSAAVCASLWLMLRSKWGLALMAIRDNLGAAGTSGVDVGALKLAIYVIGALVTGMAAGLYFLNVGLVTPASGFDILWTAYMIFIVVAGGMGTFSGPLLGSLLFVLVRSLSANFTEIQSIAIGVVSIAVVIAMPRGIVGTYLAKKGVAHAD